MASLLPILVPGPKAPPKPSRREFLRRASKAKHAAAGHREQLAYFQKQAEDAGARAAAEKDEAKVAAIHDEAASHAAQLEVHRKAAEDFEAEASRCEQDAEKARP